MANPVIQQITDELEVLQRELAEFKSTVEYLRSAKSTIETAKSSVDSAKELLKSKAQDLNSTYDKLLKLSGGIESLINKIDAVNFPERLDSIEHGFVEAIEILETLNTDLTKSAGAVLEQIRSIDFEKKFHDLQKEVNKTVKSNQDIIQSVKDQRLPEKIDNFEKKVQEFIKVSNAEVATIAKRSANETAKTVADLNIPLRMDKIDATIAGILTAVQNIQSRLETTERNILDRLTETSNTNTIALAAYQEKIIIRMNSLDEAIKELSKSHKIKAYLTWTFVLITGSLLGLFYYLLSQNKLHL